MKGKYKRKKQSHNALTDSKRAVPAEINQEMPPKEKSTPDPKKKKETLVASFIELFKTDPRFRIELVALIAGLAVLVIYYCQLNRMTEANTINRESFELVQRAFVSFRGMDSRPWKPVADKPIEAFEFFAQWENGGNTTAKEVLSYLGVQEVDAVNPSLKFVEKHAESPISPVGPKIMQLSAPVPVDADLEAYKGRGKTLAFWGWVGYKDIFSKTHVTEFCVLMAQVAFDSITHAPRTIGFSPCMTHNCDDEDCKDYSEIAEKVNNAKPQ